MTFGKKDTANMFSSVIESVKEIKFLGVTISDSMKWDKHILSAVKSASSNLYLLRQCRNIFSKNQLISIYNNFILSRLCYAAPDLIYLPQKLEYYLTIITKRAHHTICGQDCLIDPLEQRTKLVLNLFKIAVSIHETDGQEMV